MRKQHIQDILRGSSKKIENIYAKIEMKEELSVVAVRYLKPQISPMDSHHVGDKQVHPVPRFLPLPQNLITISYN